MNHRSIAKFFALFLSSVILPGSISTALAQQEPVIAPEIGQLIADQGIDAAKQRFAELIESPSLNLNLETEGLMTLMSAYMQAGNQEAGAAVGEMYGQLIQKMISGASGVFPPGMMEEMQKAEQAEKAQRQANLEEEQRNQKRVEDKSRGKSREDLERFAGVYSDPDSNDTHRSIFVTISCDGYLVTGPMWADVGPWWMRSAADKVFTYADSWTNLSFEFVGDGGRGTMLNHDVEGAPNPLENKAPLPDEWSECMERPRR
jgi:hypothetical protein